MTSHAITLTVNGSKRSCTVESRTLLVHALRNVLGVTGPKVGCETGKCGACTVQLDGDVVKSCLVLAAQADGRSVRTVEGMADDELHPVQDAFHEAHGVQCGFCTPGMVLAADALLRADTALSRAEIRDALKGNICRCTGYEHIVDAVETAAAHRSSRGSEDPADARE